MRNGSACFPDLADGLYRFSAPKHFDPIAEEARGKMKNIHANWRRSSGPLLQLILVAAERANEHLLDFVGEVVGQCEVRLGLCCVLFQ